MTCSTQETGGELGDACRRLRTLETYWRPEQADSIREALVEADGLHERQARAMEAKRAAEDALARLTPDGTRRTQALWRDAQSTVTRERLALVSLHATEVSLLSHLSVEWWWARKAKWAAGVSALSAMEHAPG